MRHGHRVLSLLLILTAALIASWRVAGTMMAERYAETSPGQALRWRPNDPSALIALARGRLESGDPAGAQALARRVLAREPLQGEAFAVLAQAAARQGDPANTLRWHQLAAQRAPRDALVGAWLAQHHLERGRYSAALTQIDRMLRTTPMLAETLAPPLVRLAEDPVFANALAASLRANPPWRGDMIAALRDPAKGSMLATAQVLGALQDKGGISASEHSGWLDSLIAQGRWGEAHARWAGGIRGARQRLPLVYNGDFTEIPSDRGFDWRVRRVSGVLVRFEPVAATDGNAAYVRFLNRRVPDAGLEHPLMLQPGDYVLTMRMRAQSLQSDLGLQWQVVCAGSSGVVGRSEAIEGTFNWKSVRVPFSIPEAQCPGQWLKFVNPVGSGGRGVSGDLWVDSVHIERTGSRRG